MIVVLHNFTTCLSDRNKCNMSILIDVLRGAGASVEFSSSGSSESSSGKTLLQSSSRSGASGSSEKINVLLEHVVSLSHPQIPLSIH